MVLKSAVKKTAASFLNRAGILSPLMFSKLKNSGFVLMYHRVLADRDSEQVFVQPGMYVLAETFHRQAAFLKDNFKIVSLKEMAERIKNGRNISRCCALTFDDGWKDNFYHAFPVLEKFSLPATIFLATGFVGTNRLFWPEELTYYLNRAQETSLSDLPLLERLRGSGPCRDKIGDENLDCLIAELKTWTSGEREDLLLELRNNVRADPPERQLMNWEEARQMQESGLVSFGAHTSNHVILEHVSLQEAEKEILQNCREMKENLGAWPDLFAYPNGNFTPGLKALLKQHGFRAAVSTKKQWVDKNCDLFEIPRIGIHQDVSNTISLFKARMFLKRF